MVSVIVPTFNRAHMIGRAIRSVLNQTYGDFEIIVVDDGSADNTEEVVAAFEDERVRYIRLEENSGTSAAPRNAGIKAARGDYIALLDSDDEWLPQKLEKQIDKFKSVSSDVGVVYCGFVFISQESGEKLGEVIPAERGDVFKCLLENLILGDTTPLVKKECFDKVGGYETEFLSCQSWDMWTRISKYYKFDFVPDILCRFHMHSKQNTASVSRQIQGIDRLTNKYYKYLSRNMLFNRFRQMGFLCTSQYDFAQAGKYFKEAIKQNPCDICTLIRFFLCKFAPRFYESRLRRLQSKSTDKGSPSVV